MSSGRTSVVSSEFNLEESSSEDRGESSEEESSVDEHRRKDLEWHNQRQEAQLKEARERRRILKEKAERAKQLALETGPSEKDSESEASSNEESRTRVQQNAEDKGQPAPAVKSSGTLKDKKARPQVHSKLLATMKPFSELPQELWEKRPPRPRALAPPSHPEVLETSEAEEPVPAVPAVDDEQEPNVPRVEKENELRAQTPENQQEQQGTNQTLDPEDSRANKRKSQLQTHVDSKKQRMQQDFRENGTSQQTPNDKNQTYDNGALMMTSTPYPNRTAKEPSIMMSPVTPDNVTRPSHVIPTQKLKTLARPPVRDQADVIRRMAQTNSSAQVQSATEVGKQKLPVPQEHGPQRLSTAAPSSSSNKVHENNEVSDQDSDDVEVFSKTTSEAEDARAKPRSKSSSKNSKRSVGSASSTRSAAELESAEKRKLERRRSKTFEDSDQEEEPAPRRRPHKLDRPPHQSRKVSVDPGGRESRPAVPENPSASSRQAANPPELQAILDDIFESSVLPISHQGQNEVNYDDNQPGPSSKVPGVISSGEPKSPERRKSKLPSFIPIPKTAAAVEPPPSVRTTRAASKAAPKSKKKSVEDERVNENQSILQRDNLIHSTSHHEAPASSISPEHVLKEAMQPEAAVSPKPTDHSTAPQDVEHDVLLEANAAPSFNIPTTRAASKAAPKSKKNSTPAAATQEINVQGAKSPTSIPANELANENQHKEAPASSAHPKTTISEKPVELPDFGGESDKELFRTTRKTRATTKAEPKSKKKPVSTAATLAGNEHGAKSPPISPRKDQGEPQQHDRISHHEVPASSQLRKPADNEKEAVAAGSGKPAELPKVNEDVGEPVRATRKTRAATKAAPKSKKTSAPIAMTQESNTQGTTPPPEDEVAQENQIIQQRDSGNISHHRAPAPNRSMEQSGKSVVQQQEPAATEKPVEFPKANEDIEPVEPDVLESDKEPVRTTRKTRAATKAAPKSKKKLPPITVTRENNIQHTTPPPADEAHVPSASLKVVEKNVGNQEEATISEKPVEPPNVHEDIEPIDPDVLESDEEPVRSTRNTRATSKAAPKSKKKPAPTTVTKGKGEKRARSATPPPGEVSEHEGAQGEELPAPESDTSWDEGIVYEASIRKSDERISSKTKKSKRIGKPKLGASSLKPKKSLVSREDVVVEPESDGEPPANVRETRRNKQAASVQPKSKKRSANQISGKEKPPVKAKSAKSATLPPEASDNEQSDESDVEEDEQLEEPEEGPSGSQSSVSSSRSRQSHRRSTFEIARSSSTTSTKPAKKKKKTQVEVTRYVGNDVFGNYHMLPKKDFLKLLSEERPDHGLDEQQQNQLAIKINHFLEDFFTQECEATDQPLGFVPFLNLKKVMIDQCLLEEDATGEDLLEEMAKTFSKEDWKRSEKVLYPSRYSRRGNNDDYFLTD